MRIKSIFFALILLLLTLQSSLAWKKKQDVDKKSIHSAEFLDSNMFKSALKQTLDLRSIYDKYESKSLSVVYRYSFQIDRKGRILPLKYFDKKNTEFQKIQHFVVSTFNKYRWAPAYRTDCKSCKVDIDMELVFFITTEENQITVAIEDLSQRSTLFFERIKYSELKNFK